MARETVVTEEHVLEICEDIGTCWHDLGIKLKLQREILLNINADYSLCREKAREMLYKWMNREGSSATVGSLADALKDIGNKRVAQKLLAKTARRLNTDFVDPRTIEPFLANRLIPLDKGEGAVRPIGVGEVIRRVIGKCVMKVTKQDVIEASGSLQVCAGLKSGSEAAVHAIHSIFEADETDAVLLIDASNAFNALNRAAALHNIRVLCPPIATYAINTYREPARLFIIGGKEIKSAEGTTQGDPLAMGIYAISLQPLITRLGISNDLKQCWFADDASGAGSLEDIKRWWDVLTEAGPDLGYYPNAKKCWLITKPDKKDHAKAIFEGTAINISTQGQKHLGAALGSRAYLEEYVDGKVEEWVSQVVKLAEYATSNPQACYAAFTFGLRHRWTYFLRTLPDIEDLLEPLERAIADVLIPSITDHHCTKEERDLVALPVRLGGLGLINPSQDAASQFKVSTKITAPLVEKIIAQDHETPADTAVKTLQQCVRRETNEALQTRLGNVRESLPQKTQRAIDLATEKGASNWLTVLPLKDMGYNLNKGEFRDAVKLRYDWEIDDKPTVCVCGDAFTIDHAMICRRGGFIIQRHNELRDLEADLLKMVCNDVEIEPVLQELTGERLPSGANTTPDARLDIHARGFWEKQRSAFFDVRVCHPNADSYKDQTPKQIYRNHENEKKRAYADRVLQVEQGTFTPLVFTSTGGMGEECKRYHSRLAELIAAKKGEDYATTVSWIRSKVSFAILRSALICLRGSRTVKRNRNIDIYDMDFQVENSQKEELKTEISNARRNSAKLQEEVSSVCLEKEQQTHKKTLEKFEEVKKSLYELLMAKDEDDKEVMETRVQQLNTTIKELEEKLLTEKSEKEFYVKEATRLQNLCYEMDNDLGILKERFEKISKDDKDSNETLPDYNNNVLNETTCREIMFEGKEEMKTELNRARTHSAKLREKVHLMKAGLEEEQQIDERTQEKLEKVMKSLYELLMTKDKDNNIETRVLALEATIKGLEEELSTEKCDKKNLDRICDQMNENSNSLKESFEKISEEHKKLVESLSDYRNNVFNESSCSEEEMRLISPREEIVVVNAFKRDNTISSLKRPKNPWLHDKATSTEELTG
ncbi:hypothetical protein ACROYT_G025795 [Oculina patagonica]